MLAGGIGNIRGEHVQKRGITVGAKLIVLGGPAMNIGLGGGAASSMASGQSDADPISPPYSVTTRKWSAAVRVIDRRFGSWATPTRSSLSTTLAPAVSQRYAGAGERRRPRRSNSAAYSQR